MRNFTSRATAAAVGAIAITSVAIGTAAAVFAPQGQLQLPPPEYYRGGSVEERYVYQQPPAIYGYPPPPSVTYYEYGPPPIVVLPEPTTGDVPMDWLTAVPPTAFGTTARMLRAALYVTTI
jgi:hypothetical protein